MFVVDVVVVVVVVVVVAVAARCSDDRCVANVRTEEESATQLLLRGEGATTMCDGANSSLCAQKPVREANLSRQQNLVKGELVRGRTDRRAGKVSARAASEGLDGVVPSGRCYSFD